MKRKKLKRLLLKTIKSFLCLIREFLFNSDGVFQPVYFWSTLFLALLAITWIFKLNPLNKVNISDTLLLGLLGFVIVWVSLYNKDKRDRNGTTTLTSSTEKKTADAVQTITTLEKTSVTEGKITDKSTNDIMKDTKQPIITK